MLLLEPARAVRQLVGSAAGWYVFKLLLLSKFINKTAARRCVYLFRLTAFQAPEWKTALCDLIKIDSCCQKICKIWAYYDAMTVIMCIQQQSDKKVLVISVYQANFCELSKAMNQLFAFDFHDFCFFAQPCWEREKEREWEHAAAPTSVS